MDIFSVISLLGGLAMFLYGMRLMSNSLKESSSGTLKVVMEKFTNHPIKAFLLGVVVTACIQSSTATIVITSGLVAAGIISLHQSLGIIIGANVGTTVTGQIIRLLDVDASAGSWLKFFQPSTLAPIALIAGIVLIMAVKSEKAKIGGNVAMGFGILFTGLLNMTAAVNILNENGIFDAVFAGLGEKPLIGYLTGAGVAFILQSSSATIGILQTFSMSGQIAFSGIYAVLVGIYLGDCVTTAIVCSIGAKPAAKRVGIVNILFNLSETVVVLVVVTVVHKLGLLDELWNAPIRSGGIANTNTVFNLGCAILLFPLIGVYEKLANRIVKDEVAPARKYNEKFEALNPVFYNTPALALRSCYDGLNIMISLAKTNIDRALGMVTSGYSEKTAAEINEDEDIIDQFADRISNYLIQVSPHLKEEYLIRIMDEYYKMISQFERLGDHAVNICEEICAIAKSNDRFSEEAILELQVMQELLDEILDHTAEAFRKRDIVQAHMIEPLEEVVDDMVNTLRDNHVVRLRKGMCSITMDNAFINMLSDIERISDVCENAGLAIVARVEPDLAARTHSYVSTLHQGKDEEFNEAYQAAHEKYYSKLY